jgi:Tfp pilus assembly protein PilF
LQKLLKIKIVQMKKTILILLPMLFAGFLAKAQVGLANVSLQEGKINKAKEAIDKALQNEKDALKSKTWFTKGEVYSAIAGSPLKMFYDLDKQASKTAFEAYKKAMELEPQKKGYYKDAEAAIKGKLFNSAINQGVNLYKEKDFNNSLGALDIAMESSPSDTTAIYYASGIAWEAKIYDKFINYAEAMSKMKFSPITQKQTNMQLAYLYSGEKKDYAKAATILEKCIKDFPKDLQLWQMLGEVYEYQGDQDKSIEFYKRAAVQFPNEAGYSKVIGFAYYNKAVAVNKEVTKKKEAEGLTGSLKDPKKQQKAKEYNDMVDAELRKALPYLEKADQLKPNDFETMDILRVIYESFGMKEKKAEMDKKIKAIGKE